MAGSVAVIGAGPGGLAAGRWLLSQGFEPTIFEQAPVLGGQWTGLPDLSGVWPTMHTNTSGITTAFSDLEPENDLVYPPARDILDYLHRYAETFGLMSRIRFGTRVELLSRDDAGWLVAHTGTTERFEKVVVATGRFQSPVIPPVPGLDTFASSAGVISTYQYRGHEPYCGKRVLVAGGAISALEIAAELAQLGATRVIVTQRRQRYLPLVAEGLITVRPWIESITDTTVTFADGNAEEFDGIVFGTGFDLHLPFLSEDIRAIVDLDAVHLDADRYTFHPDLPGLAFVGLWDQSGGYFVPLELQARWIAYTLGRRDPGDE